MQDRITVKNDETILHSTWSIIKMTYVKYTNYIATMLETIKLRILRLRFMANLQSLA